MSSRQKSTSPSQLTALAGWFFLYFLLAIVMTWPAAGRLGTHIPGSEGDAWVHLWTFNWVKTALQSGQNVYFSNELFYPQGVSLIQHNFAWFHIALWLPLQGLVGEAAAYTLVFVGGFAFTGVTTFFLAKYLTGSQPAAFIAGFIAAFWPYNLSHHNHPNLIFIGFIPVALYLIDRLIKLPNRKNTVNLAIAVALIGIVRWQHFAYAAPLLIGFWLWRWWETKPHKQQRWLFIWRDKRIRQTAVALIIGTLVMSPLLLPYSLPLFSQSLSFTGLNASEIATGSTDLLAYLTPSRYHPLWGEWAFNHTANFLINRVFTPFLGYTTLGLLGAGILWRRKAIRGWLWMAGILILLALGPILMINGAPFIRLPFSWLENSFFAAVVRRPDRFNVMLSIPVAVAAAYGFQAIQLRLKNSYKMLFTVLITGLILFEYIVTFPTFPLTMPSWYTTLLEKVQTAAILDLPMHNRTFDEQYMYYQMYHGKALVGGHVSRPPNEAFQFINQIPMIQADIWGEPPESVLNVGSQLKQLASNEIDYVILHKQFLSQDKLTRWKNWLTIAPVFEDDQLVVYETAVDLSRDLSLTSQQRSRRLNAVSSNLIQSEVGQDDWLKANVTWGSIRPLGKDLKVCFALISERQQADQDIQALGCQPLSPDYPTSMWPSQEIVHSHYDIHVSPFITGGEYQLAAQLQGENGPIEGHQLLGEVTVRAMERVFSPPSPQKSVAYTWENNIKLVGYDLDEGQLSLHWQATERIKRSAVVFVHLIDRATGEILWQHDAIPRDWSYPTTWWETGEFVTETINFPTDLQQLPVQVYIGQYDVETQERFSVTDSTGQEMINHTISLFALDN